MIIRCYASRLCYHSHFLMPVLLLENCICCLLHYRELFIDKSRCYTWKISLSLLFVILSFWCRLKFVFVGTNKCWGKPCSWKLKFICLRDLPDVNKACKIKFGIKETLQYLGWIQLSPIPILFLFLAKLYYYNGEGKLYCTCSWWW